jgi:DNA-binding transcriptional LysR family regulator
VRLTPAGDALLRDTGLLLEQVDELARRARRAAAGESGELRLGYIGPPVVGFLGPLLRVYRAQHPEVSVALEERTPERVWEMVEAGRHSLGLTRPVLAHQALGLHYETLWHERFCAAVPPEHGLAGKRSARWASLADEPLVLLARREGAGSHDAILAACAKAGFSPRIARTPSLMSTILRYVEAGTGIGIVPECAAAEPARVSLVPLAPKATVPLVVVWGRRGDEPAAAAFRDLLLEWRRAGKLGGPAPSPLGRRSSPTANWSGTTPG